MYYDKRTEEVEAPAPVKLEPWQVALKDAADVLRKYGWMKYMYGNRTVGFCAHGAINQATKDTAVRHEAKHHLRMFIGTNKIGTWNDRPEHTKEEVIAALEGAAKAG